MSVGCGEFGAFYRQLIFYTNYRYTPHYADTESCSLFMKIIGQGFKAFAPGGRWEPVYSWYKPAKAIDCIIRIFFIVTMGFIIGHIPADVNHYIVPARRLQPA